MKRIILAAAAATLIAAPAIANHGNGNARSGSANPTATNDNPSSCLGAERATRNSRGGDRMQGGFGQEQSDFVRSMNETDMNYGYVIRGFQDDCEYGPRNDWGYDY